MAEPRIRDEGPGDAPAIRALVVAAFRAAPHADGTEQDIVDRLRDAGALALSLVAETQEGIVGHVAASRVGIRDAPGWFGVGPLAVLPEHRSRGIGAALMGAALDRLRAQGAAGVVLVGDAGYYERFGFAADARLTVAGVPGEHVLSRPFGPQTPQGPIRYHPAFGIDEG